MKSCLKIGTILFGLFIGSFAAHAVEEQRFSLSFYGHTIDVAPNQWQFVDYQAPLSSGSISAFYHEMEASDFDPYVSALVAYKEQYELSDWMYYQLLRKMAEELSPKAANYNRYTLYKWYLLLRSGYDATLAIRADSQLLFYAYSPENVYDIPMFERGGRQYVCLNYHDFGYIDFTQEEPVEVNTRPGSGRAAFSYRVTQLPEFPEQSYSEKALSFEFRNQSYHFNILVNQELSRLFNNYPVVDYESYLNIPLSHKTYESLIPDLRAAVAGMKQKQGVEYLMQFTRSAFGFETDQAHFGKEKRLSPELTLFYEQSDCDDRVALFFYLVKEIYNLPMIVLLYPEHVTIAVKFDKPVGKPIYYDGEIYSVCEPTPQPESLGIGQLSSDLLHQSYEVTYSYLPEY